MESDNANIFIEMLHKFIVNMKPEIKKRIQSEYLDAEFMVNDVLAETEKQTYVINILRLQIESFLNMCQQSDLPINVDASSVIKSDIFKQFQCKLQQDLTRAADRLISEKRHVITNSIEHISCPNLSSLYSTSFASSSDLTSSLTDSIDRLSSAQAPAHVIRPETIDPSFTDFAMASCFSPPSSEQLSVMVGRVDDDSSHTVDRLCLHSEVDSSVSGSVTQDGLMFLNQNQLGQLTAMLDPRHANLDRRLDALRQIVNLPVLDTTQACDVWVVGAGGSGTQTPTQNTQTEEEGEEKEGEERREKTILIDDSPRPLFHQSGPNQMQPSYGMRLGLLDALTDDNEELATLALKFIAKGFATTPGNMKECYCLLCDYIEEEFMNNADCLIPRISSGMDITKSTIARLFRVFSLLHEFHKQLPSLWIRFPEKLVHAIFDRVIAMLTVSYSFEVHGDHFRLVTPVHFLSIIDPKADWFNKWMRGAYGIQPFLKKLISNKILINTCVNSCVRFFVTASTAIELVEGKKGCYSSAQLDAAHFLHSLHVITRLLCFRGARRLFPINLTNDLIANISAAKRAHLNNNKSLSTEAFMKLMLEFVSTLEVNEEGSFLRRMVFNCLLRLTTSPAAFEACFGVIDSSSSSNPSKKPTHVGKDNRQTVLSILLEPLNSLVKDLLDGMDFLSVKPNHYESCCQFTQIIGSICCASIGRCFFLKSSSNSSSSPNVIKVISNALCDLLSLISKVTTTLAVRLQQESPLFNFPAKLISNLSQIVCATCLTAEGLPLRDGFKIHHHVVAAWKVICQRCEESNHLTATVGSYFTDLRRSLQECLLCLAGTPRGVELLRRHGLLQDCVDYIFIRHARGTKLQKYEHLGGGLLVSRLAASETGFRSLQTHRFVELCLENAWRVLQCVQPPPTVPLRELEATMSRVHASNRNIAQQLWEGGQYRTDEDSSFTPDPPGEPLPCLWPIDAIDTAAHKPFNHLVNLFSSFAAVHVALQNPPLNSPEHLDDESPTSLFEFMHRVILLDSSSKLSALCRTEESMMFGLRLLSNLVSSLDTYLLLESRFGVLEMLINSQRDSAIESRMGAYIIDAGLVERNFLLVKCCVIGGPNERCLPARTLCEHQETPYRFPVIIELPFDDIECFTNPSVFSQIVCLETPCVSLPALELHRLKATKYTKTVLTVVVESLVEMRSNGALSKKGTTSKWKILRSSLLKLSKFKSSTSGKIDVGNVFDVCLKAELGQKSGLFDTGAFIHLDSREEAPTWMDIGIKLMINYGRRLKVLNQTVTTLDHANQARILLAAIATPASLVSPSSPTGHPSSSSPSFCKKQEIDRTDFLGFDWFAASIFLVFRGNLQRSLTFLSRFANSRISNFLWVARSRYLVDGSRVSASVEIIPTYYKICHHFELMLARELTTVFNSFRLSDHPASKVLFHWVSQCFWNYLDWPEIIDFLLLCLLCGPEFIAYTGIAIMRHLKPVLLLALQTQSHLVLLKEEPIHGFHFVDHLDYMESLAAKYGKDFAADLLDPVMID